ncbi:Thymidylate kinase [subsurface metagenome]
MICDRYLFSSLAYQSLACGFDFVLSLNQDFPLPRQLIFLDTAIPLSQQRLRLKPRRGKDLFDSADLQSDILSAYQKAFSLYKDTGLKIHRLDGSLPPEQVFDKIWNIIRTLPMLKA